LNRIMHLLGPNDKFDVRTPSSTASVRGTVFTVEVLSNTSSYFAVEEGIVQVTMGDEVVDVPAGFAVTAVTNQPLDLQPVEDPPTPTATPEPVTLCHIPPGN
ncbi:MAG: FecR domain-containing protein, partial [Anaerolineales bacterium]|nr:FecR domain-containing protein [Anaerolineales bacterium]